MSSTNRCSMCCRPIQGFCTEKVISDSAEVQELASTSAYLHSLQGAHDCSGSDSIIGRIRITSKKASKSKIQLQEEELQRRIEEDALINAEIQLTSITCDRTTPKKDSETLNQLNSSIEVQSDHVESDDDNYYIISDYPKPSPSQRFEMLKERLSEQISNVHAKMRMQNGVARRPAVLSRTRYGQLKANPLNINSSNRQKLLKGPLPLSTTPCFEKSEYVQEAYTPLGGNDDESEIMDKERSMNPESQSWWK